MELPRVNPVMLKLAKENVARALSKQRAAALKKEAFVPMGPQGATMPPPADPMAAGMPPQAMGGQPPMDPSMMGGAPPMDPSMMGGAPPMDPSMAGGAPPMDPSMMGGPPAGGPPPGQPVMLNLDDLVQLFAMVQESGAAGGAAPQAEAPASNEAKKPKGGKGTAAAIDELSQKVDQILGMLGGGGEAVPPGAGGAMPPEAMPMGGASGIPSGEALPQPEVPSGAMPEGMPPGGPVTPVSGMIAQASTGSLKTVYPETDPLSEPVPKSQKKASDSKHALRIHRMIQNLNRKD